MRKIPTHMLVAGSAWAGRVISAVAGLVTIRLLTNGLGMERYAAYAVLSGLQGWYLLCDLGVGISLQNHISERRAREQDYVDLIWAAALVAISLLFVTITALYFISPFIAPKILNSFVFLSESEKTRQFFTVGALSIMIGIGSIVYKIWYAEQRGYLANIIPAVGAVLTVLAIRSIVRSGLGGTEKLHWSLVASFVPLALLPVVALVGRGAACSGQRLNRELLRPLIKRALKFWFFGLMAAGVLQIDYVVMSQFLKPDEIVIYNLSTKIFNIAFFIYAALLAAVWPVCAEAIARNEWPRVKKYLRDYNLAGICFICMITAALILLMPWLVHLLSPKQHLVVPTLFIVGLGCYFAIRVWSDTFAMVLQSMSFLRPFWIIVPLQAALSVSLQWLLIPQYRIFGVIMGLWDPLSLLLAGHCP
ncbi:MATE family efflux transporter [Geotalea toluenoxydans]|uniref:MATE family efflux transporter n=1 Tax=Geotalea toluenoxydans TaxID=421624 RepID=UPI001FB3FA13|nr:MATE family efflux transporter [Geotalea toluenoxydans]